MDRVTMCGLISQSIMGTGLKTRLRDREYIIGLMDVDTMAHGETTIWTDKAYTHGRMAGNMRANIKMTKSMATESTTGPTGDSTTDTGKRGNNMV